MNLQGKLLHGLRVADSNITKFLEGDSTKLTESLFFITSYKSKLEAFEAESYDVNTFERAYVTPAFGRLRIMLIADKDEDVKKSDYLYEGTLSTKDGLVDSQGMSISAVLDEGLLYEGIVGTGSSRMAVRDVQSYTLEDVENLPGFLNRGYDGKSDFMSDFKKQAYNWLENGGYSQIELLKVIEDAAAIKQVS